MKKIIIGFVLVLAITCKINAQAFIGILSIETENIEIGEKANITCYVKFPYCKMEINSSTKEGAASYTLYFNDQSSDMVMVSSGTKTIVPMANIPSNKYLENILVAVSTMRSQNIAGYNCNEINLKSTNAVIQCLVAPELDITLPNMLINRGVMRALKESSIKGTPLEIKVNDLSNKLVFSQKITSVSAQALNDNIFITE